MPKSFLAQSLAETKASKSERRLELTFVDAKGAKRAISIPVDLATDLAVALASLTADMNEPDGRQFTKIPKLWAVGQAQHERLVLIRFDDDPPYGLDVADAESLLRDLREETESVSQLKQPLLQ